MFKQIASQHSRRLVKVAETRHFSISHVRQKTITEKVGEMAQNLNKKVGQGLASAIETGEKATEKTKETIGGTSKEMKGKGEELKNMAGREANKLRSEAQSAKKDVEHIAKK